jgi:hypothetical protein
MTAWAEVNRTMDHDASTRARLEQHWKAPDRGGIGTEHAIYAADAILDYPQSGERFRGRSKIQAQRGHPAERRFTILAIRGGPSASVNAYSTDRYRRSPHASAASLRGEMTCGRIVPSASFR